MAGGLVPSTNVGITVTANTTQAQQAFAAMQQPMQALHQTINNINSSFVSLETVLKAFAIGTLFELGKQFIEMASSMERLQTALSILDNSTAQAGNTINTLVTIAGKAPFSLNAITDAFLKMKTGGIEPITGKNGEGPLQDLIDAVAAFGGSEQKFHNAAFAIQEIGGKGVVQMKELRRQLGDAIPSAIQLMAEGMGISIAKLTADVTKGAVDAETGLTAMFEMFHQKYAGAADLLSKTFSGSLNQLKTQFNELAISFNKAGGLDLFTAGLQFIINKMKELNEYLSSSEGQAALSAFIDKIASAMDTVIPILSNIVHIVMNVGEAVIAVLSQLPPGLAAGGLIGYMMFGGAGLVIGALISQFSGSIAQLSDQLVTFVTSTLAFLHSFGGDYILEAGMVGYLLFGGTGALVFGVAEILDQIAGQIVALAATIYVDASALINQVTDLAHGKVTGFAEAQKAVLDSMSQATKDQLTAMGEKGVVGGLLSGPSTPATQEGDAASAATPKVESFGSAFKKMIDDIRNARAEYDGKFGKADAFGGPTDAQQKQIEKFAELSQAASDKLASMQGDSNPLVKMEEKAGRGFEQMQGILDDMTAKLQKFQAAGDQNKIIGYAREIASLNEQMQQLHSTLKQLEDVSNAKVTTKVSNQLDEINASLDASLSKTDAGTIQAAGDEAAKKFQHMYTELDKLRESIKGYVHDTEDQRAAEESINQTEDKLNQTRERAIKVARDIASIKLQERDMALSGHLSDMSSRGDELARANLYDKAGDAVAKVNDQYRHMFQQIDKEILDAQMAMEQNPGQKEYYENLINGLEQARDKIAQTQADTVNRTIYETSEIGKTWKAVGDTIDKSMSEVLVGLANNTLNLKDIVTKMYADITKAAADYIIKAAEAAAFGNQGGSGFALFNMFSGGGGGGGGGGGDDASSLISIGASLFGAFAAKGGVFDGAVKLFANGGIIGGPTLFGIAGEAGKEAIMPLETVGGKLGVRAIHSGKSGDTHFHIQALDGPSVRELLLREAPTIVAAHNTRMRLNSGAFRIAQG